MNDESLEELLDRIMLDCMMLSPQNVGSLDGVRSHLNSFCHRLDPADPLRELILDALRLTDRRPRSEAAAIKLLQDFQEMVGHIQSLFDRRQAPSSGQLTSGDVVDAALKSEFASNQALVLQDFEADCLALLGGDAERRPAILRQLHTWKGECALIGWDDLAHAIHEIEDAALSPEEITAEQLADAMLTLKDQLTLYFAARRAGEESVPVEINTVVRLLRSVSLRAESARSPEAQADKAASFTLPDDLDLDLMNDFLQESAEHVQSAESALMRLEGSPEDGEAVNIVFRAFHTVKGVSGFLGLAFVTTFAHRAEAFFDRVRKGRCDLRGDQMDLAFESLDVLRNLLSGLPDAIQTRSLPTPPQYDAVFRRLEASEPGVAGIPTGECRGDMHLRTVDEGSECIEEQFTSESLRHAKHAPIAGLAPAKTSALSGRPPESDLTVKVSTTRLDNLINMVGELVIAQSMVSQDPLLHSTGSQRLQRNVMQLAKISRSLQELSLSMRMVSVKPVFQKMARLVRDLARKSGKDIDFSVGGEDTEIDRNMVEAIADPLVHMVRNAVDHGIESHADRVASGKHRQGRVHLSAEHEGGWVVITLSDDGRGLNTARILEKAVERNLVPAGAKLPDAEVFRLIFLPGFSTAEVVSDISGRGVGMDVVRTNIEALRGTVDISSHAGWGTEFRVRLPLTLAIIDGMVVRADNHRFVIPTTAIRESVSTEATRLETIAGRSEIISLRGEMVPVIRPGTAFGTQRMEAAWLNGTLVVVEGKHKKAALLVDELVGQQQVVIKSLGSFLGQVEGISGSTILGDGHVCLIVDVDWIVDGAGKARAAQFPVLQTQSSCHT